VSSLADRSRHPINHDPPCAFRQALRRCSTWDIRVSASRRSHGAPRQTRAAAARALSSSNLRASGGFIPRGTTVQECEMRKLLLGCVAGASVLVLAAAPGAAQKGPTAVGGSTAAPGVSSGAPASGGGIGAPRGGGAGVGGGVSVPCGGSAVVGGGRPTGGMTAGPPPGGSVAHSPKRGQWSGGHWHGRHHGRQWRHRHHHGGFALGSGPSWGYGYYAEPTCELVRVRHVRRSGRVVWRLVERCY
jgi:hypothetical protein